MNRKTHAFRLFLLLLAAVLGLLLLCALAGGSLLRAQLRSAPRPPETLPAPEPQTLAPVRTEPEAAPDAEIRNILLIGRDGTSAPARSDTVILCSFDPGARRLTLTSILRDLWVPIPGHGEDRINAAYALGGSALLAQTLEEAFGIPIHGTAETDFESFARITDLLGGVDLELREDEAEEISRVTGTDLAGGLRHLNGPQALAFARIRKLDPDGDFSRTRRQRRLLEAMYTALQDLSPGQRLTLARKLYPLISTDLTLSDLLSMAPALLPIMDNGELLTQHVPQEYRDRRILGKAVLEADREQIAALLQSTAGRLENRTRSDFHR